MKPMTPTMNPPSHIDIEQQDSDTKDRSDDIFKCWHPRGQVGRSFRPIAGGRCVEYVRVWLRG